MFLDHLNAIIIRKCIMTIMWLLYHHVIHGKDPCHGLLYLDIWNKKKGCFKTEFIIFSETASQIS